MTGTSGSGTNRETVRSIVQQWTASTVLVRLIVLILLWLVLSEGEVRYWGVILGGIVAAALVSLLLAPTTGLSLSPVGLARFVPFFLMQSVLGGWDVALRALSRTPRLDPVYVECRLRLDAEPVRVLVANTMSLMPGTLSVELDGMNLKMHVLDRAMPAVERAYDVEALAASMFRLTLPSTSEDVAPPGKPRR